MPYDPNQSQSLFATAGNNIGNQGNSGSLFNTPNNNPGNNAGGSLFGNNNQTGSMFGNNVSNGFSESLLTPNNPNFSGALGSASAAGFDLGGNLPHDAHLRGANVKVRRMIIFKTGQYQDQFLRPITASAQVNVEQLFSQATNDGSVLGRENLGKMASSFIMPHAQIGAQNLVSVENGWGINRMRFITMIDDMSTGSNGTRYFLQGFFDHSEHVSNGGHFNPRAKMYFTRAIQMNCLQFQQGGVMNSRFGINTAANMLSSVHYQNNGVAGAKYHHIRPQDIFAVIGSLKNNAANTRVNDMRTSMITKPRLSNIQNDSMSLFLDTTMKAVRERVTQEHQGTSLSNMHTDRDEAIRSSLIDPTTSAMQPMNMMFNQSQWQQKGYMEWQELAALFPEINSEQVTVLQTYQNKPHMLAQINQSERMNTAWAEGILSSVISQELPPLMLEHQLIRVGFTFDGFNFDSVTREPIMVISNLEGFDQNNITPPLVDSFRAVVNKLIYPRVSQNGMAPIRFRVDLNLMGDALVEVATSSNGALIPFVYPMFAESSFLSLVTNNVQDLNSIANAVNIMTNVVEQNAIQAVGTGFGW